MRAQQVIDAPDRLRLEGVDDLLKKLDDAADNVQLRLGGTTLESAAADLMTAALLGALGEKALELNLGRHQLEWTEVNGLAFALANRPGPTRLTAWHEATNWRDDLRRVWAADWRVGAAVAEAPPTLFSPEEWGATENVPTVKKPGTAVFLNAHLTPSRSAQHPVTTQIWPWLDEFLPAGGGRSLGRRRALISDFGALLDEVLANVADHAAANDPQTLSLVRVRITHGGRGSTDRLHLSVSDTGPGIIATAAARLAHVSVESPSELLGGLLDGSIRVSVPSGHGEGLPHIADICDRYGGRLLVTANRARVDLGFGFGRWRSRRRRLVDAAYDLKGTVVSAVLPVR